ncbi:unnamed protein product, partial [Owenia fusiformis]
WDEWVEWSKCSVECGGGLKERSRECEGPYYGGAECEGPASEEENCNEHHCPVDGIWDEWVEWSKCSVECGGGLKERSRECEGPYYGGAECEGPASEEENCNEHPCPVDGVWDNWGPYGECDVSCGSGNKLRERICVGPYYSGKDCIGLSVSMSTCNDHSCPVDGKWEEFGDWFECSVSCGNGTQVKIRECNGPYFGGANCTGHFSEEQFCNTFPCPIDGKWSEWGEYGKCSSSCAGGKKERTRKCDGPYYNGQDCVGADTQTDTCSTQACPGTH